MRWRLSRGWVRPAVPKDWGVVLAVSAAAAGNMRSPAALGRGLKRLGLPPKAWAGAKQVHGRRVVRARKPTAPREYPGTDGLVTDRARLALRVQAADCVPVLLVDPRARVIGAVHAGWRGADKRILGNGIAKLKRLGSRPANLRVFLGPHIQKCCYEVGAEVARRFRRFPGAVTARRAPGGKRLFLDLAASLRRQAVQAGVPAGHVSAAPFCTAHDRRFFSYRRDKTDKRMAAVVAMTDL